MNAPALAAAPDELSRILALPRRPPIDCDRDRSTRLYSPPAQALAEYVTSRYARKRVSCACRARKIYRDTANDFLIYREGTPPPLPETVSREAFLADADETTRVATRGLRVGESAQLPGIDRPCVEMLNPVQAWVLRELAQVGGIFGFLPIGSGKTFCGILAPLALPNLRTVVLLARPDQRIHYRIAYQQLREHFRVPSLVMDEDGCIVPGTPALHFVPYSKLQHEKSTDLLESIDPDMIIADEAHSLAAAHSKMRRGSTRTSRFLRYMVRRNNDNRPVALCCWSGTLINKSILDMTHLAAFSLGMGSPYPIDSDVASEWSAVVDPSNRPDTTSSTAGALRRAFGKSVTTPTSGALASLLVVGDGGVRSGIMARAIQTAGVVSTRSASSGVSIAIHERPTPKMPREVQEALTGVREQWLRPDGDEIVEAPEQVEIAKTVAAGCFAYWAFPHLKCTCPPHAPRSCRNCFLISDWYAKRKRYFKAVRAKLAHPESHMDSPANLYNAAERAYRNYDGPLPVWPEETWFPWSEIKDKVEHESRVKWIGWDTPAAKDPATHPGYYLARDAAEWARTHKGVIWYQTVALGQKVAQLAGINCHGGGKDAEARILAEDGKKSICASMSSHSEGRDGLQFRFAEQLILEVPSSGKVFDQLLGRLARRGQTADTIETWIYAPSHEYRDAMRKAVRFAEFDEEMSPSESLLLSADIDIEWLT